MIGYLKGQIVALEEGKAIINVNGVGYEVNIARSLGKVGTIVEVFIYHKVAENADELFGFIERLDLGLFKLLLSVSGVGPRSAMSMISAVGAKELMSCIATGDHTRLSEAPGVGKKTAEKIVVSLKDKLVEEGVEVGSAHQDESDVVDALAGLGYSSVEVRTALTHIDEGLNVDEKVRETLKALGR